MDVRLPRQRREPTQRQLLEEESQVGPVAQQGPIIADRPPIYEPKKTVVGRERLDSNRDSNPGEHLEIQGNAVKPTWLK